MHHADLSPRILALLLASAVTVALVSSTAGAADLKVPTSGAESHIFDELRFGLSGSIESGHDREAGLMPDVQVLFNPFGYNPDADWKTQLAHPRVHVGTSIGMTGTAARQLYGGLTWTLDYHDGLFTEAGFGGVVHDGNLTSDNDGPKLGCHLLFHEYVAAGYKLDSHWSLMAQVNHSSHADLCDGPNAGMTRAGVLVGYKF